MDRLPPDPDPSLEQPTDASIRALTRIAELLEKQNEQSKEMIRLLEYRLVPAINRLSGRL